MEFTTKYQMSKKIQITRLKETGFCSGVKRAIAILEKSAAENKGVDCLGEVVHNPQVMQKLASLGIKVIDSPPEINAPSVAISAHGVSPELEAELRAKAAGLIDATCPSVKKVQKAVRKLAENGYTIVVFGDAGHAEVKGILGWAQGCGMAASDPDKIFAKRPWPRKIGLVSQTTQVPDNYLKFAKGVLDRAMTGNSEITILDTVCREVRRRQVLSRAMAAKSDLMLVIGGKNSANSRRLAELCAASTETHLIESAAEIDPVWLIGKHKIGLTSGTSTSPDSIDQVYNRLLELTRS